MKIQTFFKAAALASLLVSPAGAQQAITRVDGADGTSLFLVTRSGNTPDEVPICSAKIRLTKRATET